MNKLVKERKFGKSSVALFEIAVLLISTIAFAYLVGAEFRIVSAEIVEQCVVNKLGVNERVNGISNIRVWCTLNGGLTNSFCSCSSPGDSGASCNTGGGTWTFKNTISCNNPLQANQQPQQQSSPSNTIATSMISEGTREAFAKAVEKARAIAGGTGTASAATSTAAAGTACTSMMAIQGLCDITSTFGGTGRTGARPGIRGLIQRGVDKIPGVSTGVAGKIAIVTMNAFYAYGVYYGVKTLLGAFGDRISAQQAERIARAAGWGYFTYALANEGIFGQAAAGWVGGVWGYVIALAIAAAVYVFTGEDHYNQVVFSCDPWSAPAGGRDCERCNNEEFPCTEYRCKSLGQSCELVNKGTTDELCTWVRRNDVNPPVIQPWTNVLTSGYVYTPDNTVNPPDRGVKIVPQGNLTGCIAPYTPLRFGLTVNETAKCSFDTEPRTNFESMRTKLSGGLLRYNHSFQMSLQGFEALAAENITLANGGKLSIYARCKDAANNSNVENFVFKFCVDKGPDRTQPSVVTTSILNGMPIAFGQQSVALDVYVNEPAECSWSHLDRTYDDMENKMSCSTGVLNYNSQMLYKCSTTLNGLVDAQDNNFYFRCRDQPHLANNPNRSNERNTNTQSYQLTLKGTRALAITAVGPNATTIKDSTNAIKVNLTAKTAVGYKDGEAICSFKNEAVPTDPFIEFYNTGKNTHSQELWLSAANYTYTIRCVDLGGNADSKQIKFSVETDTTSPNVVRIFKQENSLKVITNEEAMCVYGNTDCDFQFSDGVNMTKAVNGTEHSTAWNTNRVYFVKCSDKYGNQPLPNTCNIIAKPFEIK